MELWLRLHSTEQVIWLSLSNLTASTRWAVEEALAPFLMVDAAGFMAFPSDMVVARLPPWTAALPNICRFVERPVCSRSDELAGLLLQLWRRKSLFH